MIHSDCEYRDYGGVERAQYDQFRNGRRVWRWVGWALTIGVIVLLTAGVVR